MFDDLAVFDAENIDHGLAAVFRRIAPMVVDHHQIALGDHALDFNDGLRMLLKVVRKEIHHRSNAVAHVRVVLLVVRADVQAYRLVDVAVLEHHAEKRHGDFFVRLGRGRKRRRNRQATGGDQHTGGQRFPLHTHTGQLRVTPAGGLPVYK
ncbi:hypothetical protein D3C72_1605070 [compost metagenome]